MTGAELRRIREAIGMSQRQLAQKLGVTPSTISLYEHDRREVPLYIEKLVRILWEVLREA